MKQEMHYSNAHKIVCDLWIRVHLRDLLLRMSLSEYNSKGMCIRRVAYNAHISSAFLTGFQFLQQFKIAGNYDRCSHDFEEPTQLYRRDGEISYSLQRTVCWVLGVVNNWAFLNCIQFTSKFDLRQKLSKILVSGNFCETWDPRPRESNRIPESTGWEMRDVRCFSSSFSPLISKKRYVPFQTEDWSYCDDLNSSSSRAFLP